MSPGNLRFNTSSFWSRRSFDGVEARERAASSVIFEVRYSGKWERRIKVTVSGEALERLHCVSMFLSAIARM